MSKVKKMIEAALKKKRQAKRAPKRVSAVSSHGKLKKGSKSAKEYMAALRKHKATHPHINLECEVGKKSGKLHCEVEKPKKRKR